MIFNFFIQKLIKNGSKIKAKKLLLKTCQKIKEKSKKDPFIVLLVAVKNVAPIIYYYVVKKNNKNYITPFLVNHNQKNKIAIQWIIDNAKNNKSKSSFSTKLADEILESFYIKSKSFKKKETYYFFMENNKNNL